MICGVKILYMEVTWFKLGVILDCIQIDWVIYKFTLLSKLWHLFGCWGLLINFWPSQLIIALDVFRWSDISQVVTRAIRVCESLICAFFTFIPSVKTITLTLSIERCAKSITVQIIFGGGADRVSILHFGARASLATLTKLTWVRCGTNTLVIFKFGSSVWVTLRLLRSEAISMFLRIHE